MKRNSVQLLAWMLGCILVTSVSAPAQIKAEQVYAATSDTHIGVIYVTIDDLPEEPSEIDGTYQTVLIKDLYRNAGFPITFFAVICHIDG